LKIKQKYLFREHRKTITKKSKDLYTEAINFRTGQCQNNKQNKSNSFSKLIDLKTKQKCKQKNIDLNL